MRYNLLYKNRETGEEKYFYRDDKRNYTAEDGTFMSKGDSFTKWTFIKKDGHQQRTLSEKKSLSRSTLKDALTTLNGLKLSQEINPSESLKDFIKGFERCLSMFGDF